MAGRRLRSGFQSPEGDSLFFYVSTFNIYTPKGSAGFSPPKGIRCFSTRRTPEALLSQERVSVPRRGFVVFLPMKEAISREVSMALVSVPRRGFVVFLRGSGPGRRGERFAPFQSPEGDSLFFYLQTGHWSPAALALVSVPRRGFVVFLPLKGGDKLWAREVAEVAFQSPEGDSLFFYETAKCSRCGAKIIEFQSPEGDSLFFYQEVRRISADRMPKVSVPRRGFVVFLPWVSVKVRRCGQPGFSPPKGIRCFSTKLTKNTQTSSTGGEWFQSPEGDSLFFYRILDSFARGLGDLPFQSPEGDSLFFYEFEKKDLRVERYEFQSPEGDSLFFYEDPRLRIAELGAQGFSPPKGIRCFSTPQWFSNP